MEKSVWKDSTSLPKFNKLEGDKKTDVLIIGGGLCGILCAYFLKQKGIDYILVEGSRIASGTSGNTTAKITIQHGLIYNELIKKSGKEKAQMYLDANIEALRNYKELCSGIDCDFEEKPSYVYTLSDRQKIEDEIKAVNLLGFTAKFEEIPELPFSTKGAVCFPGQAQFNPIKFISGIINGLNIYENTFIHDISPTKASSDFGTIKAKHIIICTHFPFLNKHGSYFLKLYQHRSYVSAFENTENINGMYVDENLKGLSFRMYNNLLLVGGGSHRTGKQGGAWHEVDSFTKKLFPSAVLKYRWAAQDCMSLDSIPYIGKYSKNTPSLYVATGFNKWGMTSSMVAAKMICDIIMDKQNEYKDVFSPQRSIIKQQLFINGFETATNLVFPTVKRCPHLGCALKWNRYEHSWDCPCHGSRFTKDGKLIDNPATGDANIK